MSGLKRLTYKFYGHEEPSVLSLVEIKRVLLSYRQALRASRRLGRAEKLRKASRPQEALAVAREGLAFLRHPDVIRDRRLKCRLWCV